MALDRQKILTELGSVISQLKNADCGCMGRLFENNGQMPMSSGNHYETCASHRPNCSECSHNMASNAHKNMHFPCMGMGGCNAPKLYSDTYNYLNNNLMKPTIKEVYEDLKSITPDNTIMNNPAMNNMNLNSGWEGGQSVSAQGAEAQGIGAQGVGAQGFGTQGVMAQGIGAQGVGAQGVGAQGFGAQGVLAQGVIPQQYKIPNYTGQNAVNNPQMNHFTGMGPQIMSMLQGKNGTNQDGQAAKPSMFGAPQFSQNENNVTSPQVTTPADFSTHYNNQSMEQSNPTNQFINQPNYTTNTCQQNITKTQPSTPMNSHQHSFGQHSQSIAKFKEMFPGVMQNDLGFDPMSIAIQMNPENQKQAAMQSMRDIMYNNNAFRSGNNANVNNLQQPRMENNPPLNQAYSGSPTTPNANNIANQPHNQNMQGNQQIPVPNNAISGSRLNNKTNYQVYSGLNDLQAANQQQQMQQPVQYQQQNVDHSNLGSGVNPSMQTLPTVNENNEIAYDQTAKNIPNSGNAQIINEPIFPVDTTKNITSQNYGYNTLGQPVKMLPANAYYTPVPSLPQTLSPQPTAMKYNNGYSKYSNVKSTVSKTSLLPNRPIGKIASRNQLQQVYNQYKGSSSYTQQNLNDAPRSRETTSDRRLHPSQIQPNIHNQIPVEKIGGDTAVNNPIQDQANFKTGQVIEQIGDAPSAKPVNDAVPPQEPIINRKCRNGLQDMTFTSYPTSAAWSFHGCERAPPTAKYRYRNRF